MPIPVAAVDLAHEDRKDLVGGIQNSGDLACGVDGRIVGAARQRVEDPRANLVGGARKLHVRTERAISAGIPQVSWGARGHRGRSQ